MKLLVISQTLGINAPGIVFEQLVSEMEGLCQVEAWTYDYRPSDGKYLDCVNVIKHTSLPIRKIRRYMMKYVGSDMFDWYYGREVRPISDDYDAILCFVSMNHYFALEVGRRLKERLNIPLFTYFVDAVPAPELWIRDNRLRRNIEKHVRKYAGSIDCFISSNEKMLEYQRQFMRPGKEGFVVYTPSAMDKVTYLRERREGDPFIFLYTGNIYGLRNPDYLIEAFRQFLKDHEDSYLYFVGSLYENMNPEEWEDELKSHVIFHPFTSDLAKYYEMASALIDIDADIPDDVYLSSKSMTYLGYNRPIICETSDGSVSQNLYAGVDSILQCSHSSEEILDAMNRCYEGSFDYTDRKDLIEKLNVKNVVRDLLINLTNHAKNIR